MRESTGFAERLRRYPRRGWIAGVCVGLGELLGCPARVIRLGFVLVGLCTAFFPLFVAYAVLWFMMPEASEEPGRASRSRGPRLAEAQLRFEGLEQRLRRMEACVTSDEFELRRQLRKLES